MKEYGLNDIVEMKKPHPCRKSTEWKIVRMGVDIKIECQGCKNVVMLERPYFEKRLKRVVKKAEEAQV